MTGTIVLDEKNQTVIIKDLAIEDPTVYRVIEKVKPRQREDFMRKAILVGAVGLRNMSIAENVDYVEKEFSRISHQLETQRQELEEKIKEVFNIHDNTSPLGSLVELLAKYFDSDSGSVASLLNPDNPESPLFRMRNDLFQRIEQLVLGLGMTKMAGQIEEVTPLKGGKFEDAIGHALQTITNSYGDSVKYVGDTIGTTSKTGDFIVNVDGDDNRSIVVECKDSSAYSYPKVTEEIETAIRNRRAKFGVFLFKSADQIPTSMQPARITKNAIVTSFEGNGLFYAYRIARMYLEREGAQAGKTIRVEEIQKEVEEIHRRCLMISEMQTKVTQITNAAAYLQKNLESAHDTIERCLDTIRSHLV